MLAWLSVWSELQTCIWPSRCHCHSLSLASVKSRLVLPLWYRLTWVVPDKGLLNGCMYVCNKVYTQIHNITAEYITSFSSIGSSSSNMQYKNLNLRSRSKCFQLLAWRQCGIKRRDTKWWAACKKHQVSKFDTAHGQ